MKKRVISFLLSVFILLGLFAGAIPQVYAAYDAKASEKIVELIKGFEGFISKPVQDNGQWSVGYGSAVEGADLEKYQANGITKAEADTLLRNYVASFEKNVNDFAKKYKLNLTQNQFDALVSFTYNLGPSWMNNDSNFRQAVISGEKGSDFLYDIVRWCTNGERVITSLIKRRLVEANVYLNGNYSSSIPSNYRYVIFNDNAEKPVTNSVRVQGFDTKDPDVIRATPSKSGYRFLGWYTQASGGAWVTVLNADVETGTLHAHWQKGDGEKDEAGEIVGVAAKYQRTITASSSKIVRQSPSEKAAQKKQLKTGTEITIVADYMDASGIKWGKLSSGGWINLHATAGDEGSEAVDPVTVTVLRSGVNIRSGPGTNYSSVGKYDKGEKLVVTVVQKGGSYLWGKVEKGWICLSYTDYDLVTSSQDQDATAVNLKGEIVNTPTLNIRSGPGTKYQAVGKYKKGDRVTIVLQEKVGSATWGKTDQGWISLYYVKILTQTEADQPQATEPTTPTEPTPTEPEKKPEQSDGKVVTSGTVYNCSALTIREAAGTQAKRVGRLVKGSRVDILETATVKGETWGRTSQGWICLTYVKLDTPLTGGTTDSGSQTQPTTQSSGTVVNCSAVNVRSEPSASSKQVGKLTKGTKVTILETQKVGTSTWGRTKQGWVHMFYIQLDKAGTTGSTDASTGGTNGSTTGSTTTNATGTVVNCSTVNIRAEAGTSSKKVGKLTKGTKVTILETKKVGSSTWGRTKQGWVHMYYIRLDKAGTTGSTNSGSTTTQTTGTVVNCSSVNVRSEPSASSKKVAKLTKGTKVTILETKKVGSSTWGRTKQGWVHMHYIKLNK